MSTNPQSVARFTSPGEIAALVPLLVGFVPSESLVVVSLRGERKRVGLTVRIDLPDPEYDALLAEQIAARLEKDGAIAAVVVVYTQAPDADGSRAGRAVVDAVAAACPVAVTEALLVRDGRWWSYFCEQEVCCPSAGTPLDEAPTPALQLVAAQSVAGGRAVLPSREELVRSVAAPELLAAVAARQRLDRLADQVADGQGELWTASDARTLLDAVAEGASVDADAAAALAIAVHHKLLRDEVATWALDRQDELLALLLQVARQVVPPYDAPICTLVAWVAYAGGDGGLANVALDRALASDPAYSMAHLLRTALDGQVAPKEIRSLLRGTRRTLSRARRPTSPRP